MMKNTLAVFILFFLFSCSEEKEELPLGIKEGKGTIWLSGGLWFCAEQIRMDNGDTLIPIQAEQLYKLRSGTRVQLQFKELDAQKPDCDFGKTCEIIEIETID